METLNTIEKITLIISVSVVTLIHLSIAMDKFKMKLNLKRFSKISLIMFFIVSSFLVKSQDTIYFKNKTTVAAKITEVGISEIKYQRLDNLTGPNYLATKSEISIIKYSNGITDSINSIIKDKIILNNDIKQANPEKITIIDRRLIYNGVTISDRDLSNLIDRCENPEKKALLKTEYKKMKKYKSNQRLYPPLILATSFVVLIGTAPLVTAPDKFLGGYSQETLQIAAAGIIGAALTRITGFVVNKVNQNKRWNKRNEIALLYNDFK